MGLDGSLLLGVRGSWEGLNLNDRVLQAERSGELDEDEVMEVEVVGEGIR